jgi:hypothetical protein
MASAQRETFKLKDRKGAEHEYAVFLHNASEAVGLAYELTAHVAEPALLAIVNVLASGKELADMDTSALARATAQAFKALTPQTQARLFEYVARDGKMLKERAEFDAAYAGNYGEMMAAALAIVRCNGFVPLDYILERLGEALSDTATLDKITTGFMTMVPAQAVAEAIE